MKPSERGNPIYGHGQLSKALELQKKQLTLKHEKRNNEQRASTKSRN